MQRPAGETQARMLAAVAQQRWIIEGNHSATYEARLQRADLLIWLDLPTGLCLRRVLRRTRRNHGRVRPSMSPGCPERWSLEFLFFVATFRRRKRWKSAALVEGSKGAVPQVVLRDPGAVDDWLGAVARSGLRESVPYRD